MFNKQLVERWIEALEHNLYLQCFEHLRSNNRFCPMGVVADLYDPTKWEYSYYDGKIGKLPPYLLEELGLNPEQENIIINMNDQGYTFPQIAVYIKSLYKERIYE